MSGPDRWRTGCTSITKGGLLAVAISMIRKRDGTCLNSEPQREQFIGDDRHGAFRT